MGGGAATTRAFPSPGIYGSADTDAITAAAKPTGGVISAKSYVPPPPNSILPAPKATPPSRPGSSMSPTLAQLAKGYGSGDGASILRSFKSGYSGGLGQFSRGTGYTGVV